VKVMFKRKTFFFSLVLLAGSSASAHADADPAPETTFPATFLSGDSFLVFARGGYKRSGYPFSPIVKYLAEKKDPSFSPISGIHWYGVRPDGAVIGIGGFRPAGDGVSPHTFPRLQLFHRDGTLDSTFQGDVPPFGQIFVSRNGLYFSPPVFFVQSDGKILGGTTASEGHTDRVPDPKGKFLAMRWLANGSLDSTFGTNGVTVANMDFYGGEIVSAVLNADGSGSWLMDQSSTGRDARHRSLTVWNLSSRGALQKTRSWFRPDISDLGLSSQITLQADSRILVSGIVGVPRAATRLKMVRYAANGSLDSSFGQAGVSLPQSTGVAAVDGVRVNSDESIDLVVTQTTGTQQVQGYRGVRTVPTYGLKIMHFGPDGTLR
jgi:hypothetical protein